MMEKPNAQYNVAAPGSLPTKVATMMRRHMFRHFLRATGVHREQTILDVGVTSDRSYDSSNYLEAWYPHKDMIVAVGLDDTGFLGEIYPGVTSIVADGRNLPFPDNAFDFVHSSAVLEHVGGQADQERFVSELFRVSRFGACITTPNRWFPVEFHTVLPLVHWLPKSVFRSLMTMIGRGFFAQEKNLNLLGRHDLQELCRDLSPRRLQVDGVRLGGWTSNLMLYLWK